jgi:hypothetical protein
MSLLHQPAIERVKDGRAEGDGLLAIMEALAQDSENDGLEVGQLVVGYVDNGDVFEEGTYVPELWIVVRKVLPNE